MTEHRNVASVPLDYVLLLSMRYNLDFHNPWLTQAESQITEVGWWFMLATTVLLLFDTL